MEFHKKQQGFIENIVYEVKNSPLSKKPIFIPVSSSPGSGKTTIILESCKQISEYLSSRIEYEEGTNVPIKQIIVLAFDKKMKKEIEKKIQKHPDINEDLFEVANIHSLFFRELQRFQKNQHINETFELDYTKGFFTKKSIEWFLRSLIKSEPSLSNKISIEIDMFRFFKNNQIVNKNNIDILWAIINTYFSSPYTQKMIGNITQDASFFLKGDVELNNLEIPEEDLKTLKNIGSKMGDHVSEHEVLFRLMIKRINQLAVTREKIIHRERKITTFSVDVVDSEGNFLRTEDKTIEKEVKREELLDHLIKVPHCFYYKAFYNKILKDKSFAESVFGHYKAVLVDEAQDQDRIFFQIIVHLAKNGIVKNFAFVGDSLQSIYGFKSPDHFDMLSYLESHSSELDKFNINYSPHSLDITFRFGKQISNFVNSLFGSKIKALSNNQNFVYPKEIKNESLHNLIKNLSDIKGKTTSIICRSNAEAMKIYVDLKTKGVSNVVLHSSSKDELKDFTKKGTGVIDNERTKAGLIDIISQQQKPKEVYSYEEVLSNSQAISYLANNGYSHLVKFSKEEINNYIIPPNRQRKDVVWIGTAHLFKGAEFDYTIVAGDFFRTKESIDPYDIVNRHQQEYGNTNNLKDGVDWNFAQDFLSNKGTPQQHEILDEKMFVQQEGNTALKKQLHDPENKEEKCIYYVAYTRAKEGIFVMENQYWNELSQHIENNFDIEEKFGYLLEEKKELQQEFDFAGGLMASIGKDDEVENQEAHLGLLGNM